MRSLTAFALVASFAIAPIGSALAAGGAPATTQILQQRTADGSLLLTDRPAPGATTERTWQIQAEDQAAARQRALDVKVEAQLVSERIQRGIERQQQLAEAESERLARMQYERQRDADLAPADYAVGGAVYPYAQRGLRHGPRVRHVQFDDKNMNPRGPRPQPHMARLTGPAAL